MPTVFTIGYSQDTFAPFEERLAQHDIDLLVDVRSAPWSRYQTDFRYGIVEGLCRQAGLDYRYMGDRLGGKPDNPALLTEGAPDHAKIRDWDPFQHALNEIAGLAGSRRIALMCGCAKPLRCHRGTLLAPELIRRGLVVKHIVADGVLLTHEEAESEENGGQGTLF